MIGGNLRYLEPENLNDDYIYANGFQFRCSSLTFNDESSERVIDEHMVDEGIEGEWSDWSVEHEGYFVCDM